MPRPKDLPSIEILASKKPHGDRVRYMGGCRCVPCRAANSRYECRRAELRRCGLANGIVSARRTRQRLITLGRQGIGYKTVARAAGVSRTVVAKIRFGQRTQIRAMTEKRILDLGANLIPASRLEDARPAWRKIHWLIENGFTKAEIARRLGKTTPALQIRDDIITHRTAQAIDALWRSFQ
jgi:hypothetical protein